MLLWLVDVYMGNGEQIVHVRPHVVAIDIWAFVLPWHQVLYPGMEEICVKCLWPGGDSVLCGRVYCKLIAGQVILKGSREFEVTVIGRVVQNHTCHSQVQLAVWGCVLLITLDTLITPGWQAIYNRHWREASCYLPAANTWCRFHLHHDARLHAMVEQTPKCL